MFRNRPLILLSVLCVVGLIVLLHPRSTAPSPAHPPVTTMPVERPVARQPLDLSAPGLKGDTKTTGAIAQSSPADGNALALDANALAKDPDVQAVVKANNQFAIDLYKEIAKDEKGNIFFSPFSISCALAMVYAGARGQTAEEMAKVLHFPPELTKDNGKRLHAAYGKLIRHVVRGRSPGEKDRGYEVRAANGLWGAKGLSFLPEYVDITRLNYRAEVKEIDFAGSPEESRKAINEWAEGNTNGKVKQLIPEGKVHPETAFVLANAIYLRAKWATAFNKETTKEAPFTINSTDHVKVRMMGQKDITVTVLWKEGFTGIDVPYKGWRASLLILLPDEVDGLAAFETLLASRNLGDWVGELTARQPEKVELFIPRFRQESRYDLAPNLQYMGIRTAFTANANLTGLAKRRDLALDFAVHAGMVEVDEEGTEAAAATAVGGQRVISAPVKDRVIRVDHPFIGIVRDGDTGCALFMVRIVRPASGG